MRHKFFPIEVAERRKDGGRIIISTGSPDRDRDRVLPAGARVENYLRNPIVQWGHNYRDPWATIGRTTKLEIDAAGIVADFELRPPANEQDPQNIIQSLWDGGWVRTASIGFAPDKLEPNDMGGFDFPSWELLEWSIVPIPANQDALRLNSLASADEDPLAELKAQIAELAAAIKALGTPPAPAPAPIDPAPILMAALRGLRGALPVKE